MRSTPSRVIRAASNELAKKLHREFACSSSKEYKGLVPPKCNGGKPCTTCREKYAKENNAKSLSKPSQSADVA